MINKIIFVLRRNPVTQKLFRAYDRIRFSRAVSIPQIRPVSIKKSAYDFRRINLLIPSINKEHFFGGTSTAFKLFGEIIEKMDREVKARIIITDAKPKKTALENFKAYRPGSIHMDSDDQKQLVSFASDRCPEIFVTAKDRFICTAWWTAYAALKIIGQQIDLFGPDHQKLLYLIQDFEPSFYNWSSHYALAESTYQSNIQTIAVFNSLFLKQYFNNKNYQFFKEYVFEPRLNPVLKKWLGQGEQSRKKTIVFYGRPSVNRNCFPLIIEALRIWVQKDTNAGDWKIVSVGEDHPHVDLGNDITISSMGKLSLEAYAKLLLESAVGLSLMASPHPSYPPLEMAHFGMLTITNAFANKDLSGYHSNILSIPRLTPKDIAQALHTQSERFISDPEAGNNGKSKMKDYLKESDAFLFTDALIADLLGNGVI